MATLDLSAPAAAPTLVLSAPKAQPPVETADAVAAVPLAQGKELELSNTARSFVAQLTSGDVKAPDFSAQVAQITTMGQKEMRGAAAMSNRMLERPAAAGGNGKAGDAQTKVGATLLDLRNTVTELDPNRADLTGIKKVLKWLPGGSKIDNYFAKYQSAQSHIDAIIKALDSGQDDLRKDNASIETEKEQMWELMGKLREYDELAAALDAALEDKIAELQAAGRTDEANTIKSDALFPVRQRRMDLQTQMAVNVQGYMALDLVKRNNLELIKGVDRAQTTTIAALRTAVIVSQALARQQLVLEQITALNTTTSNLIEGTSRQLALQGAQINQQAASATLDVEKLKAAFDNVFATMDALDSFRAQSVEAMGQTVATLEAKISQAQPYLERTRAREGNEDR